MRLFLGLILALTSVSAFAQDNGISTDEAVAKPVNSICPMEGNPIDAKVGLIPGRTSDGKTVMIGCCTTECAAACKKSPDEYADDAVKNKVHEFNGKNNGR